ncbi:MAG: cyclase family protein [Lachnospiraceae bacterium]|nr:cyclase family protein [Lachnospiraceae bacterium]
MKIIDLSLELDNDCMTCGTPWHEQVNIRALGKLSQVGRNTSTIKLGSHSGTHIDAPLHFFDNTYGVDKLNLNVLCGQVQVVNFTRFQQGTCVGIEDIKKIDISERMIFRFDWHKKWKSKDYYSDFPYFTIDAAKYLVENGLKLIALDTPSPDSGSNINELGENDSPVHKLLLSNDVIIAEYLTNTDKLDERSNMQIVALPLKIEGVDGSPARIIVMEE